MMGFVSQHHFGCCVESIMMNHEGKPFKGLLQLPRQEVVKDQGGSCRDNET